MDTHFARIVLKQVDQALLKNPSRETLLGLLQIADPSFADNYLCVDKKRESVLRSLNLLIHPDKHPGDRQAKRRFQETRLFYDACLPHLHSTKKRKRASPPSDAFPLQFSIQDKWPFLAKAIITPRVAATLPSLDAITVAKIVAYSCVNYRGAIAHGKRTELSYGYNNVEKNSAQSASQVLDGYGGYKNLISNDEIKKEIMLHGPVVSASFQIEKAFLKACENAHTFESSLVGQMHAVLLVGWKQTAFGEVWLIRSLKGKSDIPIAIGQYSLEEDVLAPLSDFSDYAWQNASKALDLYGLTRGWYSYSAFRYQISDDQLKCLFKALGCSWAKALSSKTPFVVRDATKIAHSRYAYLMDIEWIESKKKMGILSQFLRQV